MTNCYGREPETARQKQSEAGRVNYYHRQATKTPRHSSEALEREKERKK